MAKRLTPAWLLLWGVTVYACGGEQVSTAPEAPTVASVTSHPRLPYIHLAGRIEALYSHRP